MSIFWNETLCIWQSGASEILNEQATENPISVSGAAWPVCANWQDEASEILNEQAMENPMSSSDSPQWPPDLMWKFDALAIVNEGQKYL